MWPFKKKKKMPRSFKLWFKWFKKIEVAEGELLKVKLEICSTDYWHPVEEALFKTLRELAIARQGAYNKMIGEV